VGILSALWSGSFVVSATEAAFDSVWEIPYVQRRGFGQQLKRSLLALGTIGLGLVISTLISSYVTGTATGTNLGALGRLAGYLIAVALDVGLFLLAFRLLTARTVSTREVLPGALLSGLVFWVLQQLSALIISRYLHSAEATYGTFATVITMLWWFYLQSIVTLLGAQLNVVLTERLHPRALIDAPATEADRRAYDAYAHRRLARATAQERFVCGQSAPEYRSSLRSPPRSDDAGPALLGDTCCGMSASMASGWPWSRT
jgi:uncharacterized BrkB/YihY/UPF0761 family membrane protein